jgi:hypothetical protein
MHMGVTGTWGRLRAIHVCLVAMNVLSTVSYQTEIVKY